MQKVYHFDSSREKYHCDACVVGCFDNRFELACRKFLKYIGVTQPDPIKVAGGPKSLASPEEDFERRFILDQIQKSIRLHGTRRVILLMHSDCGAYGGLERFKGDSSAEAAHHKGELTRAAACMHAALPFMQVDCFYVDFEGVWEVPVGQATTLVAG